MIGFVLCVVKLCYPQMEMVPNFKRKVGKCVTFSYKF
ncbi:hypothetical protein EDD80_102213 [Anseongella ginsenosidimutans]|uniref:Uncharacterized protein n=1 Tax=Anseongella ginsenosidimutans TaxID=496056 RepID=A0A4R3KYE9_9SPHI|nr:hypothetical protein EDD80_102213 [Anseongella ginsenosidimutans]